MQSYDKNNNVVSGLDNKDPRTMILAKAKQETAKNKLYAEAYEKYGTKRWEDAWRPFYNYSTAVGVIGNTLSALIGTPGCMVLAGAMIGGIQGAILGIAFAIFIELFKFAGIKYGTENVFAGRASGYILLAIGAVAMTISIYTSYESALSNPTFQKWIKARLTTPPVLESAAIAEIDRSIIRVKDELKSIQQARDERKKLFSKQNQAWYLATEEQNANTHLAQLNARKEQAAGTATQQAQDEAMHEAQAAIAWWIWALILLPEILTIFGYSFCEYYEWRVYQLSLIDKKALNTETIIVEKATTYQATTNNDMKERSYPDDYDNSDKLIARLLEKLGQQKPPAPTPLSNTPPLPASPAPPPENGKTHSELKTANTNPIGFSRNNASAEPKTDDNAVITVTTDQYDKATNEFLLAAYRKNAQDISIYKKRMANPGQKETAEENLKKLRKKIAEIQSELYERGKQVVRSAKGRSFELTDI